MLRNRTQRSLRDAAQRERSLRYATERNGSLRDAAQLEGSLRYARERHSSLRDATQRGGTPRVETQHIPARRNGTLKQQRHAGVLSFFGRAAPNLVPVAVVARLVLKSACRKNRKKDDTVVECAYNGAS